MQIKFQVVQCTHTGRAILHQIFELTSSTIGVTVSTIELINVINITRRLTLIIIWSERTIFKIAILKHVSTNVEIPKCNIVDIPITRCLFKSKDDRCAGRDGNKTMTFIGICKSVASARIDDCSVGEDIRTGICH